MSPARTGTAPGDREGRPLAIAVGLAVPVVGGVVSYLAARFAGPWAAAIVSAAWAGLIGWSASVRVEALRRSVEHHSRLARLALVDDLTGLANDRSFRDDLAMFAKLAGLAGEPLSLVLIDVDRFKPYNDHFGHPAGDSALRAIGACLAASSGEKAQVYRVGGDEFALILPRAEEPAAIGAAGRVRSAIGAQTWPHRPITVSFGVASTVPGFGPADLRARADRALYRAKATGGDRVVAHEDDESTPG